MLSSELLKRLVCPKTGEALRYVPGEDCLVAPGARLKYRITDGVPVLLVEEAVTISASEASALVQKAQP